MRADVARKAWGDGGDFIDKYSAFFLWRREEGNANMTDETTGNLIALMTDADPNLLKGLFGILRSGNGFVPIDPAFPAERIDFVLADCGIEILVTDEKFIERAKKISQRNPLLKHIICIGKASDKSNASDGVSVFDCDDYRDAQEEVEDRPIEADDIAYVIYTSGSTGNPKGVVVTHGNLSPLLSWSKDYFNLGQHTNTLQNLSYCFDFGVFELLTTVIFGGTLHFLDKGELNSLSDYAACLARHSINTIHCTPSFIRELVSVGEKIEGLEVLHMGGEQLSTKTVEDIFKVVGKECVLYNGYGPTEATINSMIFKVGTRCEPVIHERGNVAIGKPSAASSVYVLDEMLQPVPIGIVGELYIGGPGVAPGYLNRADLTAERFMPDPFNSRPGARLYRTGDMVRHLAGGNIEFIGRMDNQVKVRGFRIELAEVETVLGTHRFVRDAAVEVREFTSGDRGLVAYVVAKDGMELGTEELRQFMKGRLPEFMVPSAFIRLESLPLTPNGKLDRKSLPAPTLDLLGSRQNYVAPRSDEEAVIADIWSEILRVDNPGIGDNFLALGGNSLLAMRVITRIQDFFQVSLTPRNLFENPTIAGLAQLVEDLILEELEGITDEMAESFLK